MASKESLENEPFRFLSEKEYAALPLDQRIEYLLRAARELMKRENDKPS